ncbi:helix-turn-helix domain-containing protein [Proteus myxofaciens]|uniref:Transcriptional regulator n=1 Tax=Proteus myxofaciens ATCC 19692 TaxID=1354337 RepID=A0A198FPX7_9GAMM|nr:XRE family transcriptional regulator [Proteus myxofaciens]OAT26923.1 transcriptional regulator [Proteus myxofaciens ATCC 19692]
MNPQSPKKTNEYLGNKVKQLRQSRNLSLNELSRKSGISKAALSKLESGDSNPRIDTLEAIAIALGFPLGDLFSFTREEYPRLERHKPIVGDYAQEFKFRIGIGNITEIWHIEMKHGAIINSPAHVDGTQEHIMVYSGKLMMRFENEETVLLETGDFYAFHGNVPHSYICVEGHLRASVIMSSPNQQHYHRRP